MERAGESLYRLCQHYLALAQRVVNSADLDPGLEDDIRAFGTDLEAAAARHTLEPAGHDAPTTAAFLVSLAHDLRSPIGALVHQTQLLASDSLTDDAKERSLSVLEGNVGELELLLQTLADIEQVTLGDYVVRVETTDLAAMVREVVSEHHGADVRLAPLADRIDLQIDPLIARRVLRIVLRSLARGGRQWVVEVCADEREAVVRAVRQGDADASGSQTRPRGVTLDASLLLAVALVELHRGRLTFTYGAAVPVVEVAFPILPPHAHPSWDAEGDR